MSDLIDRQAAIDSLISFLQLDAEYAWGVRECLNALPSAQPEPLTDDDFETIRIHLNAYKEKLCNQQRWKEAEEYQRIIDRFMAFASAQPDLKADYIEAGKMSEPRWIPVTKKTPDAYGWYLCSLKDGRTTRLYFDKRKSQWIDNAKKHMFEMYDIIGKFSRVPITEELADVYWDGWVTAWMPLPEPYREEKANGKD